MQQASLCCEQSTRLQYACAGCHSWLQERTSQHWFSRQLLTHLWAGWACALTMAKMSSGVLSDSPFLACSVSWLLKL